MYVAVEVVTPPAEEPVTLRELKLHARIDVDTYDELLWGKLVAARIRGEEFCRRSFVTQTLDVWYDSWHGPGVIDGLPRGKVQSIVGIYTYEDYSDTFTTVDSGIYTLVGGDTIVLSDWISFRPQRGIRVRIVSGYGDPEDVPGPIKEGILQYATHLFEHRLGEGEPPIPSGWRAFQVMMV